jgi:hypothetical protein
MMLFGGEREGQTLSEVWRFHFGKFEFILFMTHFSSTVKMQSSLSSTKYIFNGFCSLVMRDIEHGHTCAHSYLQGGQGLYSPHE